jgi:hypothetical protein
MNDGTQPFGPILAFSKKDHAFATRFFDCASRWRAIIPRGDEEEIAVRGKEFFRSVALLATCAFLERHTLIPTIRL